MLRVPGSTPNTRNIFFLCHLPVVLGGDAGCATMSDTFLMALPASLAAVSLYVVGAVGDTLRVPDTGTVPIPWSIKTDVAFVTFHDRTAVAPGAIEAGDTENTITGNLVLSGAGMVICEASGWDGVRTLSGPGLAADVELELPPAHDPNKSGRATSNKIKMYSNFLFISASIFDFGLVRYLFRRFTYYTRMIASRLGLGNCVKPHLRRQRDILSNAAAGIVVFHSMPAARPVLIERRTGLWRRCRWPGHRCHRQGDGARNGYRRIGCGHGIYRRDVW
jgi:hypothetical protein